MTARLSPPRPRPKEGMREWLGDVASVVFWPFLSLLVVVLLAFAFVLFMGLAS